MSNGDLSFNATGANMNSNTTIAGLTAGSDKQVIMDWAAGGGGVLTYARW
jgi:hypothetical protein